MAVRTSSNTLILYNKSQPSPSSLTTSKSRPCLRPPQDSPPLPLQHPPQFEITPAILLIAVAAALTPEDDWAALAEPIAEHRAGELYHVVVAGGCVLQHDVPARVVVVAVPVKCDPVLRVSFVAAVCVFGGDSLVDGIYVCCRPPLNKR